MPTLLRRPVALCQFSPAATVGTGGGAAEPESTARSFGNFTTTPGVTRSRFRSGLYWRSSQTGTLYLCSASTQSDSPGLITWLATSASATVSAPPALAWLSTAGVSAASSSSSWSGPSNGVVGGSTTTAAAGVSAAEAGGSFAASTAAGVRSAVPGTRSVWPAR